MKKKKILHLILLDKFIAPFIDLLETQEDFEDHIFYIRGDERKFPVKRRANTLFANDIPSKMLELRNVSRLLNSVDKIILHGLFDLRIIVLLFFQPWLLKKSYWVIWGGDLYSYQLAKRNWKWRIKEFFRRPVIKRMGHLLTYIEGDVDLARKWYGATGQYHECIMYTSNVYHEYSVPFKPHSIINIQVGNSADPSNNHFEILERLLPFREQDIVVHAPLAYGDQNYAKLVIRAGKEMFGEKFRPMTNLMPFDQYLDFLGEIDVAIFNHKRQQAMGNTVTLLGMGKKVYLRADVTSWEMLERIGAKIYDVSEINFTPLDMEVKRRNQSVVKNYFSKTNLLVQLRNIFEG